MVRTVYVGSAPRELWAEKRGQVPNITMDFPMSPRTYVLGNLPDQDDFHYFPNDLMLLGALELLRTQPGIRISHFPEGHPFYTSGGAEKIDKRTAETIRDFCGDIADFA